VVWRPSSRHRAQSRSDSAGWWPHSWSEELGRCAFPAWFASVAFRPEVCAGNGPRAMLDIEFALCGPLSSLSVFGLAGCVVCSLWIAQVFFFYCLMGFSPRGAGELSYWCRAREFYLNIFAGSFEAGPGRSVMQSQGAGNLAGGANTMVFPPCCWLLSSSPT